ncbi:hypothetical protein FHETE_11456 [Fusarium heterosporum]|uniref:Protein kinase domain-containing protein n=1 Tax=Fusarium heterosporum TaxID=42747 RepID=A0A8H5SK34_FUSHE|nr:hypothetical protein FHETE_11456 [Fusarium heterosporum]
MATENKRKTRLYSHFRTGLGASASSVSRSLSGTENNGPSASFKPSPTFVNGQKKSSVKETDSAPEFEQLSRGSNKSARIDGKSYQDHYHLSFYVTLGSNRDVMVAYRRHGTGSKPHMALLTTVYDADSKTEIGISQSIQHDNILSPTAVYGEENELFVAYEFLPISLSEVIANRSLTAAELASILKQITSALLYLERHGLSPTQLSCSDVLLDQQGNVKIWGRHYYKPISSGVLTDSLCRLTAQLMSGCEDVQPDEVSCDKWTNQADVLDFLRQAMTERTGHSLETRIAKVESPLQRLSQV